MAIVYCVEDDENIRDLITYTLNSTGFQAIGFSSSDALLAQLPSQAPDVLLLDIMLPGCDGLSLLKMLRADSRYRKLPIIMLTAKGSEYDKIIGLDSGADDYVSKPFSIMELVSRIKALLRRTGQAQIQASSDGTLHINGDLLVLNPMFHFVKVQGQEITLTYKEFELLHYLMENKNIVISRDKIINKVWNYDYAGETRTVDVHIRTLRQKLGCAGSLIETVRGIGYKIGDTPCKK